MNGNKQFVQSKYNSGKNVITNLVRYRRLASAEQTVPTAPPMRLPIPNPNPNPNPETHPNQSYFFNI